MKISIVIPSRGGATRLTSLLNALATQQEADVEAVVVLDGDIDGSAATISPYHNQLDLRVVEFEKNRGRSAALNAGFDTATGDVLVRCDDDLTPAPDYARRHASHHSHDPVGVVGLYLNDFPDTSYARAYGNAWDGVYRRHAYARPADDTWRHWAGNVSCTRETWERVGPYDEGYRHYGYEDVDWGYRLHLAGIPVVLDPQLETPHHLAAVTCEIRARRAFQSGAARLRFERKHDIPQATQAPNGAWGTAIAHAATNLTEARAAAWGSRLDKTIGRMPRPVAYKLVAFLVEASALAGTLHPDSIDATF